MEHPVEYHIEYRTKYLMECIIPSIFIVCLIEDHLEYSIEYIRETRYGPIYGSPCIPYICLCIL